MKNLKKIALLLSILTVFAVSCKSSQDALNSTFDVITDDETSVPDNPPEQITGAENPPFPEDFIIKSTEIYYEPTDRWSKTITVQVDRGSLKGKSLSLKTYASFESRTAGVANPSGVLSSLSIYDPGVSSGQLQISDNGGIHAAMGSSGQRAKVKLDIYIDAKDDQSGKPYKTGIRTVYLDIYRRY